MKKLLSLCLLLLTTIAGWAQTTFTQGDFTYTVTDEDAKTVSIAKAEAATLTGALVIPTSVTESGETYAVTSIAGDAFMGQSITSVTIPSSIMSIGYWAFRDCYSLANIRIEDSENPLSMLDGDSSPFSAYNAYAYIAERNVYIGRNLTLSETSSVFGGITSVEFGPNVTTINSFLFYQAAKLSSVTIGNGVTTIGDYAFQEAGTSVEEMVVTMGNGVTSIGVNAFYSCSHLKAVTLPSSLTEIKAYAFQSTGLTRITIPASVTNIREWAFRDCYSLANIRIEDSSNALSIIGGYYTPFSAYNANIYITERNVYIGRNLTLSETSSVFDGITSVEFGPNVTTISQSMFYQATNLSSATIGSGVTTIGDQAFLGCSKLTSVNIREGVTHIGEQAFHSTGLTSVTIPASVMTIGNEAFNFINALESVTIADSETPLTLENNYYGAFQNGDGYGINYYTRTIYIGRNIVNSTGRVRTDFDTAEDVIIGPKVTTINESMFDGCQHLRSVVIGDGVTSIGDNAFRNCGIFVGGEGHEEATVNKLTVTMGKNVKTIGDGAFLYCSKLTSIEIPNGVTRIGVDAFNNSGLTSITIPASVETIGNQAFNFINSLESVTIADGDTPLTLENTYYGTFQNGDADGRRYTKKVYLGRNIKNYNNRERTEFDTVEELTVGPKVTTLRPYMFAGCYGLQSVDMTNATGLTTICKRAFDNCDAITNFTIPASVTTIEASAFWNMDGDLNLTIEDSETPLTINSEEPYYPIFEYKNITGYIGRNIQRTGNYENEPVFNTSSGYQHHLNFGPKVTAIGEKEYYDCDALRTVSGMSNVVSIGQEAFKTCSNLTSVELGTKLTTMGDYAFQECEKLESIVIPGTLKKIPTEAFENCFALASVTLSDGVEEIGNGAFYDTDALTEITIPASMKKIGRAPFYCNNAQAMKRMIIADSDEPLEFANGMSEYNWGRDNITDDITLDYFYLGRDVARERNDQSLVYEAKEIEIGPKVTTISDTNGLFYKTEKITSIKVHALTPFAINDDDFYESANIYTDATLQVPGGTKEAYAAADGWKKFTNIDHWSTLVTLTATNHGSIATAEATASNGSEQYRQPKTDAVVYTLTADEGYELTALTDNDAAVSPLPALGESLTRANASGEEFVTLNATFSAIAYTLNYELAGGSVASANPATYTIETADFTLNNPTKTGYDFAGWKLNGEGEAMMTVTIAKGSTGHLAYTATWTPIVYNIALTLDGGEAENPSTYTIESAAITLNNPTKTGHTFKGWKKNGEGDALMEVTIAAGSTGHLAYTATWQVNQYTITFDSNGGTEVDAIKLDYGTEVEAPANPTRTGYTFAGWLPVVPATIPAEDITCVAQWTINQYTITFNTAGGSVIAPITQDYATAVTAPANPTRTGYTFAGWDKDIPTNIPAENVTITATWTPVNYTISYVLDGGNVDGVNPTSYTIESAPITLINPTKDGYDFAGWTGTGLDAATKTVIIATGNTGDRSYTATWTKKTYTVSITGGGVTADNNSPKYGDNVVLTIMDDPDATLTSLTVNGLEVKESIVDNQYTITSVSGNVSVVATWSSTKEFITLATSTATFSCSQDLNFTGSELRAYIAAGYDKDENSVLLVRVYNVPANTGLVIRGEEGETYKISYSTSHSYFVNLLKEHLTSDDVPITSGDYNNYVLKRDADVYKWQRPTSGTMKLGAKKAYLQLPTSFMTAAARELNLVFEDDSTTDISKFVLLNNGKAGERIYNLNGQQVDNMRKGVYIVNGRKVMK